LLIIVGITLFVSAGLTVVLAKSAHATDQTGDLSGWAWSSNIGWISFNSTDPGAGGGSYKVTLDKDQADPSKDVLNGWAWSPHIGWIAFGEDSNDQGIQQGWCPTPAGDPTSGLGCDAIVDPVSGTVTGWGHVVVDNSWIQLSGTGHSSPGGGGVKFDPSGGTFSGYAWEPTETGWVNFSGVGLKTAVVSTLSAGCNWAGKTGSGGIPIIENNKLIYQGTASGGSGHYNYAWYEEDRNPDNSLIGAILVKTDMTNSNTDNYTLDVSAKVPNVNYNGRLDVSDADNPSSPTVSATCTGVTGTGTYQYGALYIGRTLADIAAPGGQKTELTVTQGQKFALVFDNDFGTGYRCTEKVTKLDGTAVVNPWGTGYIDTKENSHNAAEGLATAHAAPGKYLFSINCGKGSDDKPPVTVKLYITSTGENEF